jgi:uncharacterized Tic20 family protein
MAYGPQPPNQPPQPPPYQQGQGPYDNQYPGAGGQPGTGAPAMSAQDERTWGMLGHLGIILFGFIPPLIVYLAKKDQSPFLQDHGRAGLNFSITATLTYIAVMIFNVILSLAGISHLGVLLWLATWITVIVFAVQAGMAANRGQWYAYPLTLDLVK